MAKKPSKRIRIKLKPEPVVQSAMRLPVNLHDAITRIAARKRLSINQAVTDAVERYVKQEEEQP